MKRLMALLALTLLSQSLCGEEHQHGIQCQHPPRATLEVAHHSFVAVCPYNDLYMRFDNLADARRAAADHARATGHPARVVKD